MAESTSKLRAQVKALTNVNGSGGVDILADEKTFRSTYDIMSDIADVWSGMSDIDQSALLELLAGKVRSNQVAALLSNFDQAEKALETSQNAEGTMDKVHRAWMDSVEARKAQFEAAQEALSMTVMPANTLKGLYQTGTSALGLLNTVVGATSPVGFGAGIFGVANALRSGGGNIAAGLGNMTGWHRDMFNGGWTRGDLGFVNAYNDAFSQTGDKQAAFDKAISQNNKQLDSYTMSLYSNTSGLIDASKVTKSFGSQIASFAKNAAVGLATFGVMELAAWGLNAAWQWFNSDILHRGETLANNAATAHAEAEQASQAADARREELQTVQEQIQGMEQKRQTSGGLTSAEEAELMELRSQQRVAQYRQDIAEAQEKAKGAAAVTKRTKSYEWDRATQTTLGAALPGATSGVNALDAFEAALVTARDRLKTLNKGSQEYLDTQEDVKTLSAWHRQLNFRMAASKAGSVEGQALLARYGQAQDLDLAGRYQSKVNDRVAKLNGSYADLQARSDTLAELFDFINNTDNLSPEALGEAYKFASQEYNSLMDAINKREGAAAELGKDENAAFSQLYQKSASTDAKLADTLDKMETDAQSWLGDYFRAGEQVSDVQGAAMRDYIGSYLGLREAMQPGQKLDAVRSLLAGTPLAEALMALDELAAKGQLTADSIEGLKVDNVEDAGQRVAAALALFGINLTQAADMWNAARDESRQPSGGSNPPAAKVDTYGQRKTSVAGVFAAQDAGEKLWSSSGFSGTMTMDDYEHMMALDDGAYQAAIQYANGGLFFNKDVFDKLVQQKYREELNGLRKDVADTQKKYAEAAERLTAQAEKKRTGAADFDEMAMNAANDDLQTAAKELAGYRAMQAMIQNGMTDYANWLRNKSGPESGDMYDELGVAAQAILSGKESGKVGTRQFEAAMRLYTGQENFDVNNLTKKDWSTLRGLSGVDSTGKAVEGLAKQTLFGIRNELRSMGILGKNFEILDKNMTAERMSELYNKQYGANTNSEFMTGLFMALNDYIQNPANKYQIGATETPEDVAMQDAAREFAKIAKDFKDGKATAEDLLAAAGKLDEATNTALQTTGTEDAKKQAEEMVDAKTQADTLASIDKSLSNLVDISQQQLDVQTGKKSTTEDDNAGGGQGGAGGEGGAGAETEETQAGGVNGYNKYLAAMAEHNKRPTGSGTTTDPRDSLNALLDSEAALDAFGELSGEALNQWRGYQEAAEQAAAEGDIPALIQNMSALGRMIAETNKATAEQRSQQEQERQKAEKAAEQAAEAQAKEDQRNRLLEAATPDAVAAIEDQQSQATARGKAETAARKALEEEAAAAENALRETNAQRYGEAYDKAMTSPDIDHGGPGQKAMKQAFDQIGAAFEAGDWEAFESAMQNLDQVTAAVAAADQERREREQQESDDRAAGEALQARLEEQKQNAEQPTVSTDLDKPLTEETAVSAAEETTATLAELAQADQERVAAEQEQSNLLAQNVQGQEDLTEAVQDNQPPEQPAVSTDFNTPLTEETGVSAAEAKAMEQALLAQEEAARQQMESAQKQRAMDAADLDRQERAEQAASDAAAGQALKDRREEQQKAQQEQHDRLLEAAMPDAVAAISDQIDQARKRGEAENEARRELAEEAAKAAQQPTVSTDFDTPLTAETGVSAAEVQAMEQALLAQTEAAHQQLEGTQELSEAVQDNTEQVAANTAATEQTTETSSQEQRAKDAAVLDRQEREERARSDAAAGQALQDRLETQSKLDQQAQLQEQLASAVEQAHVMTEDEIDALYDRGDAVVDEIQDFVNNNLDGNEQLSAAGMELNNALRGLSSEVSPEQLAGMIDDAEHMLDEARGVVDTQANNLAATPAPSAGEEQPAATRGGGTSETRGGVEPVADRTWLYSLLSHGRPVNVTGQANDVTIGDKADTYPAWMDPVLGRAYKEFKDLQNSEAESFVKAQLAAEMLGENFGVAADVINTLSSGQLEYLWDLADQAHAEAMEAQEAQPPMQAQYDVWDFNGMDITTSSIGASGQSYSIDELSDYLNGLFDSGVQTIEDLINADNPANGGLGVITDAFYKTGQEEAQPELADNVALQASSVTMPDLSQVSANGNVDLNARPQISGQQMLAAGWQEFAENLGDYATLFSSTSTGGGMTSLATPIGANGTVYSPNDFFNYLDWLHGTSSSAADMINRDNPNNGGLGLLISAIDGESEETIQAMDQLGQQLSQSQAEMYGQAGDVDLQADNVNVGTTPDNLPQPAAGAQEPAQQAKEPVDTTTSASVEPEIPSTNKEVSVDTKSATITLPSGSIGISSELRSQGQSALFGLEDSSYAMGMRPGGEALSPAEVQAVNNAINSLSQALTGDDAQALTTAMGTATQIMQGNIAVSPSAAEAVQSGSGSGSGGGGGQAPVTQATVQVTAETPEIPTPEAPSVTIPVTAEEADIPTPDVPSVVIPVSYSDPGSLSVPQPAGVTIPVAWGDPGPAPGGGGGGGSTFTFSGTMAAASGTEDARGGTTLVDELGAELIEHRSRGTYELGTDRGARFTKLDPGDIVHNAKETSKILHRGKAMWRGGVETGRAAAASLAPDYSGKTRYTFTADNITVNTKGSTPSTSMQGGYMSASTHDDLYKWLTSAEHGKQEALAYAEKQKLTGNAKVVSGDSEGAIGKEFLEWIKKLIDWIPTYLTVLKKKTTAFINAADDAIHYLSKNQLLDDAIGNVAEEIKANMQAVMRYQAFLNEMASKGFSQDMIDKIQNGTIDISQYADEDTVKSIQAYQEYWNKLVACREALQSLNAQMEALSAQKLEHVVDYFDRIDSLLRDQQKTFESLLSMKKQYGEELKVTDYVDSLQTMEQVLANAQNEETALIQELKDQLGVDGDLVNAILKGGREVWDTIAEHVKKNTYSIVEDVKPEVQEAYAESRKNAQKEEEASKKQASTFTVNGTTYYKTSSGKYRSMANGSYITASAAKKMTEAQQEAAEETKPEDLDFSITDVPVTPITDEEIIELGEKLGMVMTDGSEEALANFETIKSLLTTSWEHPLAIGSDTWYEYMSTLERLRESIYSTKTEIGELKDEMADIPLTNLKTGFDYLEEIQRNLEDMNSLLDAQGSAKYEDTYRSLISVGMKQIENLQEQNKLIQEQMDGLDPLSEKYQELRSNLNGNLDTIADIRKSQEEWNDEIIDLQIDRLRKQNDSYKEQLRLMEALDDLDKARQRRLLIYHEDTGFQYEADEDELESAQEAANDAIFNNIISDLEKSKADSNIYGPLGERLISGSSILDSLGNTLVPVEDKLSGLNFEPYYQSILSGSEQSGLLEGLLQSIDLSKLLEASIGGGVNIDIGTMTLNEVQNAKDLGDAIINQLPSYLLQALYKKGAN